MQVIEIVTFKVKNGVSQNEVIEVNKLALAMIEKLDGFMYRSLAFNKESYTWFDVVYWENAEAAKVGGELFMQSEACKQLMDIVVKESTTMQIGDILYMSECTETENYG